jgi:hypothetical protein
MEMKNVTRPILRFLLSKRNKYRPRQASNIAWYSTVVKANRKKRANRRSFLLSRKYKEKRSNGGKKFSGWKPKVQ